MKKIKNYYLKKREIPEIILSKTRGNDIIYGARAINAQVPNYLKKYTEDYDIFTEKPYKKAREVERVLDRYFGGNYFKVIPAVHEGTFRIKSLVDNSIVADYTKKENKIPYKIIGGKKYIDLNYVINHIKKTLKDKESKYRWKKDKESLNRIKISKKNKYGFGGVFG